MKIPSSIYVTFHTHSMAGSINRRIGISLAGIPLSTIILTMHSFVVYKEVYNARVDCHRLYSEERNELE